METKYDTIAGHKVAGLNEKQESIEWRTLELTEEQKERKPCKNNRATPGLEGRTLEGKNRLIIEPYVNKKDQNNQMG